MRRRTEGGPNKVTQPTMVQAKPVRKAEARQASHKALALALSVAGILKLKLCEVRYFSFRVAEE